MKIKSQCCYDQKRERIKGKSRAVAARLENFYVADHHHHDVEGGEEDGDHDGDHDGGENDHHRHHHVKGGEEDGEDEGGEDDDGGGGGANPEEYGSSFKTEIVCIVQSESLSLAMFVGLKILVSRLVSGSDPDKLLQHN